MDKSRASRWKLNVSFIGPPRPPHPPIPKQYNKAQQGRFYINQSGFPNRTNQPGEADFSQASSVPP